MEGLLQDIFNKHIAPRLDGRDAARLCRVSKKMKQLVEGSPYLTRRRVTHYIRLNDVSELDEELGEQLKSFFGQLVRGFHGNEYYHGEGRAWVHNKHGQYLLFNNHYDHLNFMDDEWLQFAQTTPHKFWLIQYPPLTGVARHTVESYQFWRGCCAKVLLHGPSRKIVPEVFNGAKRQCLH